MAQSTMTGPPKWAVWFSSDNSAAHDTSLYKGAAVPVLVLAITPAALGMAEAANG
jgi:hypothetical protein